uniref:Eukaryotic translation initiation factor 3 subunit C N-terminal domain-containing protein n=1 Tax=Amphiprion percula TaxID=161767 RepID=A0A3P8U8I9_AMPPE
MEYKCTRSLARISVRLISTRLVRADLIKTIRNAMKIRDMAKCLEEFEQLCRAFLKSKHIVDKEGVPSFYIRLLADLEDYLNQHWEDKEGKKKMNKNNAKALSTLCQKIHKYNRDYETEIAAYKENPQESADEEVEKEPEDSGSSSDSDGEGGDEGVSSKSFLKKKPEAASEASKLLKSAKGSGDELGEGTEIITAVVVKKLKSRQTKTTQEWSEEHDRAKLFTWVPHSPHSDLTEHLWDGPGSAWSR